MPKNTICLGIESTAHTFGASVLKGKKVLSNIKDTYTTEKGGIIPIDAAKHHEKIKDKIVKEALDRASVNIDDIDIIAFSRGPGLAPCLLQGLEIAKRLSKKLCIPLIPVNHCIAHLEIGRMLCRTKNPVLLYTSGANTQVISYAGGRYRIFGETLDMGIGNFIDAFARHCGMGFPGGPKIYELAKKSNNFIELPYSVKGMNVSFSGLLTNLKQKYDSKKYKLEDLAFSLQETAFAMLIEVSERAMAHLNKNELLLGGGVACNERLQKMCRIMCNERNAKFFCPKNEFLLDNAAMIAWTGILMHNAKIKTDKADIKPYQRTDDVDVKYI